MSRKVYISEQEERQKKLITLSVILLLLLILVICVRLRITDIRVYGNAGYQEEEIIEMILPEGWTRNPFVAFCRNEFKEHENHPFIASYDVKLRGPVSCDITVYEKMPIGYIDYMSAYMYFDAKGIIIESSARKMEEIPEITGLKFGEIVLGKQLNVREQARYDEIMNITQQLSVYGISCQKIHFDQLSNITLTVDNGDIRVKLGNGEYLTAKLSVLGDVIGEIRSRGLKGTADLSGYQDRSSNGFTFIPDKEA